MCRPDLNPIEHWNALAKLNYRKLLLNELLKEEKVCISPIVTHAIETINNDSAKRIAIAGLHRLKT